MYIITAWLYIYMFKTDNYILKHRMNIMTFSTVYGRPTPELGSSMMSIFGEKSSAPTGNVGFSVSNATDCTTLETSDFDDLISLVMKKWVTAAVATIEGPDMQKVGT